MGCVRVALFRRERRERRIDSCRGERGEREECEEVNAGGTEISEDVEEEGEGEEEASSV